jgi:hypothetical protein
MKIFSRPSLYVKDPHENQKNKEIYELIKSKISNSENYTDECVKFILKKISKVNFIESSSQIIIKNFREEPCVSLEEKKQYNINSRQKINKEFFDLLSEKGKHQEYILLGLENIILSSIHKINNTYELHNMKKMGIKYVTIECCNDDRDCPAVKKYCNKEFKINQVPDLPLPECTADLCRCFYSSIISDI